MGAGPTHQRPRHRRLVPPAAAAAGPRVGRCARGGHGSRPRTNKRTLASARRIPDHGRDPDPHLGWFSTGGPSMGRVADDLAPRRRQLRVSLATSPPTEYLAHVADQGHVARATGGADVLYAAATDLLRASDSPALLAVAVRYARKLLSTDIAFVMLLDPARNLLRLEASVGHRTPTFTTIVRPVQAVTAVGSGKPVQSSDFLND